MRNPTVVFTESRKVEVQDLPVPKPGPGQLLIRTHCSLVSIGTELSELDAEVPCGENWERIRRFPLYPGYDNVGTVIEAGEGVERKWVGRRVASYGTHGGYVLVSPEHTWHVNEDITDEQASFLALGFVALNALRRGRLVFGESAVVFGLGNIGQITVQLCRFAGAKPILGVDTSEARMNLLPKHTSIIGVVADKTNVKDAVTSATHGRMADVVFELTGNPDVIPKEFEVLRREGRCVIASSPLSSSQFDFHDLCNGPSITIIGAHNSSHPKCATGDNPWTWDRHAEMFFDLLADGEIDVDRLISHREPVEKAPELYEMLLEDRTQAMGVILQWPRD